MIIFVQEGTKSLPALNIFQKAFVYLTRTATLDSEQKSEIAESQFSYCDASEKIPKQTVVIDLSKVNQTAQGCELGFSTFITTAELCHQNLLDHESKLEMKLRKRLLRDRYFRTIEKQQERDQFKAAKKSPNIQGTYGKPKTLPGFSTSLNSSDHDGNILGKMKKKQWAYQPNKPQKYNRLQQQKNQQFDDRDLLLRKKAIDKVNSFSNLPIVSSSELLTKINNEQTTDRLQKLGTKSDEINLGDGIQILKQKNKKQQNTVLNPFLSRSFTQLDLKSIISGSYGNYDGKQAYQPKNEQTRSPSADKVIERNNEQFNQQFSVGPSYSTYSNQPIMFNSAISSNTAFQLETFQYGGLKSNIDQGNVCLTQYNSSANENEEKKNVLSMFFAKSIDDTHSLFSEPERTTKKARPSRQRGKDKTRIG